MTVTANAPYAFTSHDRQEDFRGALLIYVGWNRHMMFASPYCWPLPPDMPFGALIEGPMAQAFGQHPDWAQVDWNKATWTCNGEPFRPDLGQSLAANGLPHKASLTFTTPGLDGIGGMGF